MTLNCPSSVKEGGLVAQATFDGCRHSGDNLGRPYCEFRDQPGINNARGSLPANGVGERAREYFSVEITNAPGGVRYKFEMENLYHYVGGTPYVNGSASKLMAEGETWRTGWDISGVPNYTKGSSTNGVIKILRDNTEIDRCEISVIDDDNTAYIGQRNAHPYGGTWKTTPECYTPGCAWQ